MRALIPVFLDDVSDSGCAPTIVGYSHLSKISAAFNEACDKAGVKYNPDVNTPSGTLGVTKVRLSTSFSDVRYLPNGHAF